MLITCDGEGCRGEFLWRKSTQTHGRAMNPVIQPEKIRFQIEVTPERVKIIEDMMRRSGVETRKEFFNAAITALGWMIGESEKGNDIAAVNRKDQRFDVLRMPELDYARHRAERA